MLYLFTTGTRTPLIALLALRRPKNLAPIVLAYAALGLVAVGVAAPTLPGGTASAAIGAFLFGGDGLAAAIGAGTRDPAVTAGFAIAAGLAGAAAVPLAYTGLVVLSLAVGKLLVARQA